MVTTLLSTRCRGSRIQLRGSRIQGRSRVHPLERYLRLACIEGPRLLLTSRISGKCAFMMMLMTAPSLIFSFLLTVPGLIFQSPQQQAYFYFSEMLNEDPARWIALFLAGTCTLMSLAVPAITTEPAAPRR